MKLSHTKFREEEELDVAVEQELSIVLYNDEVNTFDHVIECLMAYCSHSPEQAEQCAWITHLKGKCAVKNGSLDVLKAPCEALQSQGLSAVIE